jgi:tetratricopeptide (TPR) repeat protein
MDIQGWILNPGTENLGKLAARYPSRFGTSILTTNFDPLIEVAIRRAGGHYFRTILHSDGNLSQTEGIGCHVIHLHGGWYGSDTLHTARQLAHPRPRLKDSLHHLMRHRLVVVCAYGGWDDAFTEALMEVVRDDTAYPEVVWTFHPCKPDVSEALAKRLEPGLDRGRVNLYAGIDCNQFFPKLHEAWLDLEAESPLPAMTQSNPVQASAELRLEVEARVNEQRVVEGDDEDRPPVVEICVGREAELRTISESEAKVVFLTGLGGQGKSTVAARYFTESQNGDSFSIYVWRDCKEESERFENQLASVIERLSGGRISGEDLAKQSATSIVEVLLTFIRDQSFLFVFDNVDHYVNLETGKLIAGPDAFVETLLQAPTSSRAVFTCRPSINYDSPLALSCRLEGISIEAAVQLFSQRGASSSKAEIEDAYGLTEGHAFWLDLLAVQVAKRGSTTKLTKLVNEIRSGGGPLPEKTLNSIWNTLPEREQTVLRAMAETVKPETEASIAEYLGRQMHYNKLLKALNSLRALSLLVVKQRPDAPDVLELHPMVRQFVRNRFSRPERATYIDAIIKVYRRFIGSHRSDLSERPPLSVLQYWTQGAELDTLLGRFGEAFAILADVAASFYSSAYPREFCRTARLLLSTSDWVLRHQEYKYFESAFQHQQRFLAELGEYEELDKLLDEYEKTLPEKDARYIHYCQMRCYSNWARGDFNTAMKWGKLGRELKASGVDTKYDIAHDLALAERDAGHPELALPVFLQGRSQSDVTDPEELDEAAGGALYGNVGRCLHFVGQIDAALVCYQKAALLLEKTHHIVNQGFARQWIGEVLLARQQFRLAAVFLRAAYLKWEHTSPPRASQVKELAEQIKSRVVGGPLAEEGGVESICRDWILGRNVDSRFR